jgi:hypothetical protein
MGLPADASGAYRPNPQATTKLAPRPSSRKGYEAAQFLFSIPPEICYFMGAAFGMLNSLFCNSLAGKCHDIVYPELKVICQDIVNPG